MLGQGTDIDMLVPTIQSHLITIDKDQTNMILPDNVFKMPDVNWRNVKSDASSVMSRLSSPSSAGLFNNKVDKSPLASPHIREAHVVSNLLFTDGTGLTSHTSLMMDADMSSQMGQLDEPLLPDFAGGDFDVFGDTSMDFSAEDYSNRHPKAKHPQEIEHMDYELTNSNDVSVVWNRACDAVQQPNVPLTENDAVVTPKPKNQRKRNVAHIFDEAISLEDTEIFSPPRHDMVSQTFLTANGSPTTRNDAMAKQMDREMLKSLLSNEGNQEIPVELSNFYRLNVTDYFAAQNQQGGLSIYNQKSPKRPKVTYNDQNHFSSSVMDGENQNEDFGYQDDYEREVGRAINTDEANAPHDSPNHNLPWHVPSMTTGSSASRSNNFLLQSMTSDDHSTHDSILGHSKRRSSHARLFETLESPFNQATEHLRQSDGYEAEFNQIRPAVLDTSTDYLAGGIQRGESLAFFTYINNVFHANDTAVMEFTELLGGVETKAAASQAFFNILDLCSKQSVSVIQNESYGNILVRVV